MAKSNLHISKELLEKRINLLPDQIRKKRKNKQKAVLVVMLLALLISLIGYYTATIMSEIKYLKEETQKASDRIVELKEQQAQQAVIHMLEEKINYKKDLLDSLETQNESIGLILGMIDISLPDGVVYSTVSATSESEIMITGASESYEQIADFIHNLKETHHFDQVFLESSTKTVYEYSKTGIKITNYTYVVKCIVGGEGNEN